MTKENFKEGSHLFEPKEKLYEKINFKLNILKMGTKIETFSIEKKFFKKEKEKNEFEEQLGASPFFKIDKIL